MRPGGGPSVAARLRSAALAVLVATPLVLGTVSPVAPAAARSGAPAPAAAAPAAAPSGAASSAEASPTPPSAEGDTRSSGVGAGFVGQPLVAILLVVLVGVGAAAATLAYVRLTRSDGG